MGKVFKPFYDVLREDIIGDTSWHGESYADEDSYNNMEQLEMILAFVVDRVRDNANLADNAATTASGAKLKAQAEKILKQQRIEL